MTWSHRPEYSVVKNPLWYPECSSEHILVAVGIPRFISPTNCGQVDHSNEIVYPGIVDEIKPHTKIIGLFGKTMKLTADLDFQGKGKQPVNLPPTCHSQTQPRGASAWFALCRAWSHHTQKFWGPILVAVSICLDSPSLVAGSPQNDGFQSRNLLFIFGAIFRWAMLNFGAGKIWTIFALPCFTHHSATNGSRIPRRLSHSINWRCRNKKSSNFNSLPTISTSTTFYNDVWQWHNKDSTQPS